MKIKVRLTFDRSTKNTHRYNEVDSKGNPPDSPVVRNVYVSKASMKDVDPPDSLTLTLTDKASSK